MAKILEVIQYPNPVLKKTSLPVSVITPEILELIDNMFATMYAENGLGLSAIQVGIPLRIFVADLSQDKNEKMVFINPVITQKSDLCEMTEGCLSVKGIQKKRLRYSKIKYINHDQNLKRKTFSATGTLSQCIQHELDHLNGIIFHEKK